MIKKLHGLSPSGGLVSYSGGFASLFFDQVEYCASIKLCQALSRQGAIIKIPVVRCHYLWCSSAQLILPQKLNTVLWNSSDCFGPFIIAVLLILHFLNFSGETATCMYNSPHETESLARVLPGKLLTLDAQCRKDRGTSACFKVCIFARFPSSSSLKQKKIGFFELH